MSKDVLPVAAISLSGIGKKFNDHWIFRNINFEISSSDRIAITGNNGSGKSTLLQIIAGYVSPSEGTTTWKTVNDNIPAEQIFQHLSLATPYLELIEDFTLRENIDFFSRMKPLVNNHTTNDLIELSGLQDAAAKNIKYFSSGMKQRVKLTLAFMADSGLLLLDEPLSNLDARGYEWYHMMLEKFIGKRMLIICSNNVSEETRICNRVLNIEDFKK